LQSEGRFTTYLALRQLAEKGKAHPESGPHTYLAPNDAAFAALPAGELDRLKSDPALLRKFFDPHTLSGRVTVADMVGPGRSQSHRFKSMSDTSLEFSPAPAAPAAPTATTAVAPVGPVGPIGSVGPVAPAPAAPAPAAPEAPTANTAVGPVGPVEPTGPVGPEAPAPAAPQAPTATEAVKPVAPTETPVAAMPTDAPLASPAMVPIDPITVQAVKDALTKMQATVDATKLKMATAPTTTQTEQTAEMEKIALAQSAAEAAEATKLKLASALLKTQQPQILSTQTELLNSSSVFEMSKLLSTAGL
jgi:hypothetical protein